MSDPQSQGEPTMEEILASIRKIISEDDAPGEAAEPEPPSEPPSEPPPEPPSEPAAVASEPAAVAPAEPKPAADNVLELTQMVEDDGTLVDLGEEASREIPAQGEDTESADIGFVDDDQETEDDPAEAAASSWDGLVSDQTAASAVMALSRALNAAQASPDEGVAAGGGQTLEALVRSALEPYLKSWLDANLAAVVERVVREEVQKLVRRIEYR